MEVENEFDVVLDSRKRALIKGAMYDRYHVREFTNGVVVMVPQELRVVVDANERVLLKVMNSNYIRNERLK